ncbi:MAG: anthranilate phosphoribosyltransferase [Candidatus Omnitrophota bacterium]
MEKKADLNPYIDKLNRKIDLSMEEAASAMSVIMSKEAPDSEKAAFLVALQAKGPTTEEIASFAFAIRQIAGKVETKDIKKDKVLADTCGTGGGAIETFNVSTTSMFILSASGMAVAKHGNRAITSKCGSADVLEELGVNIAMEAEIASRCLAEIDIAFFFAPLYHGAFKNVQKVRRQIRTPTVFNILGPLVNPAFSSAYKNGIKTVQILGVNSERLTHRLVRVLKVLNLSRAMVVYGLDAGSNLGMDEISTIGDTRIYELTEGGEIKNYVINPQSLGIEPAKPGDLTGGTPQDNARILTDILSGKDRGPKLNIVLLNAAAGLYLGDRAKNLGEGIKVASDCIDSGSAMRKLDELRRFSNLP